ncbi:MAG: YXWGXW repeat-containing protein [Opitutaceae bacterium]
MNPKQIPVLALAGVLTFLAGCASEPTSVLVTAPPPNSPTTTQPIVVMQQQPQQVIVTQPAQQVVTTVTPTGATASYVVLQAPPAPQAPQAIPARPSSSHAWVDGYWTWQNNRYEWMAGHWEVPPFSGAKWVNPRVESEGGAFRFYEGRWL